MTEPLHFLQNLVDIWHHILAIYHDGSVGAVPQSHMQHSTILHTHSIRKQNPQKHTLLYGPYTVGDEGVKDYSAVAQVYVEASLFFCVMQCKCRLGSDSYSTRNDVER